jgi:hypothetical protein
MGTVILAVVLGVTASTSHDNDHDLAELLASISNITSQRWQLTFDPDTNTLSLRSKERIDATLSSGGNSPFEISTDVAYSFRVLAPVDERILKEDEAKARESLAKNTELARTMPQQYIKGHIVYSPRDASQWQIVLQIQRAEAKLRQIPQYAFRSVYLAPILKTQFTPHNGDPLGESMLRDINNVYALLRPLHPTPPAYPPQNGNLQR